MNVVREISTRSSTAPAFSHWIDNEARPALAGTVFERINPFDGSVAGVFANGTEHDAEVAINSARAAFDRGPWAQSTGRLRYQVLSRAAEIVAANAQVLAERMTLESGKPLRVALGEVQGTIKTLQYYAGAALALEGSVLSDRVVDALGLILREPVGVAAFITPWNFPLLNPGQKAAAALAAGCTAVAKPSHLCPGPTVLLAQYLAEAGLPPGVFNVVTSDIERGAVVGQALASSDLVDKVAFTGSTNTGRAVMRAASATNKRIALELGGKSANIVFDDAPFEEAAATAIHAFCFNSGQQCSAGSRLLVQRGIYDRFLEAVVAQAKKQVLGDPRLEQTTMGPLVNREQHKRVLGYIDVGNALGRLMTGGGVPSAMQGSDNLFIEPTIFADIDNSSQLAQEEVFGPVLAAMPFDTEEEAIELANANRFGLAGGVWTKSIGRAIRVVKGVRTGKMFVNSYNSAGIDDMPHGGNKDSGMGREAGREGLAEFQQVKTVQIKLVA